MESTEGPPPSSTETDKMTTDDNEPAREKPPLLTSYTSSLLLLLTSYQTHFSSVGYVKESTLEVLDRTVAKRTLRLTVRDSRATKAIGSDPKIWTGLTDVFRSAFISLENRCYTALDSLGTPDNAADGDGAVPNVYDGPSSNVIVTYSASLLPDLQRLETLLAIARNILSAGEKVQNLAAQTGLDREICSVINLAVKVTARGYDGDGGQSDEDRFSGVVSAFKKLLITSLQFLNNLVTMNERLKLMLWVELFDASTDNGGQPASANDIEAVPSDLAGTVDDMSSLTNTQSQRSIDLQILSKPTKPLTPYLSYMAENGDNVEKEMVSANENLTREDIAIEVTKRWHRLPEDKRQRYNEQYKDALKSYQADLEVWERSLRSNSDQFSRALSSSRLTRKTATESIKEVRSKSEGEYDAVNPIAMDAAFGSDHLKAKEYSRESDRTDSGHDSLKVPQEAIQAMSNIQSPDYIYSRISQSAADGIKMLEDGKAQLLKRLDHSDSAVPTKYDIQSNEADYQASSVPGGQDETDSHTEKAAGDNSVGQSGAVNNELKNEEEEYDDEDYDEDDEEEEDDDDDDGDEEDEEVCNEPDSVEGDNAGDYDDFGPDDEENSEEEDDYSIPGEDGRGLLTDVPLILGPNEIEVLPMLIMSGITTEWSDGNPPNATLMNMHTIRCHLLLAQENGRNLLRELLIYVAAWDLREEELYFKFMVKIMEAILLNGLLPYAYGAFKESKDIISPAQAVIMKLLTKVFHTRQAYVSPSGYDLLVRTAACSDNHLWGSWNTSGPAASSDSTSKPTESTNETDPLPRADIQTVYFLVTEFRTVIIPQICVLIFLQGQIRAGRAQIEDFPQNLWEMERIYEGVYQYLEFFAILTDHDVWKERMANWELISELVTLLRELEFAIPKKVQVPHPQNPPGATPSTDVVSTMNDQQTALAHQTKVMQEALQRLNSHFSDQAQHSAASPASASPMAMERPYDVSSPPPNSATPPTQARESHLQQTSPNANPPPPPPPPPRTTTPGALPAPLHDEPAEFEWRNLKKLCVLVLSSLVWKSKRLQDQVRDFGGINVLLSCCNGIDEHNPYIREHAIMCLRFLIEGNAECANVVKDLAQKGRRTHGSPGDQATAADDKAKSQSAPNEQNLDENGENNENTVLPVPPEVLDHHGYETFMDGKGQVGLRRKVITPLSQPSTRTATATASNGQDAHDPLAETPDGGDRQGAAGMGSANTARQSCGQTTQGSEMHVPPPTNPAQLPEWMQMVMRSLPRTHLTSGSESKSPLPANGPGAAAATASTTATQSQRSGTK